MKIKVKNIFLFFVVVILFGVALSLYLNQTSQKSSINSCGDYEETTIILKGKTIEALVADTECKRELGLSEKNSLEKDKGMLFVFNSVGYYGFWMKDMNFPIDIIWIDNDFYISGLEKNVSPDSFPEVFGQNYEAEYVLEVPAGYADDNDVSAGDKLDFAGENF